MTEEKKYKKVQIEGLLRLPGDEFVFYLLKGVPIPKDSWLTDDMTMWNVVQEKGRPFHILVKGPFMVSYQTVGKEIEIEDDTQDELDEMQKVTHKLFAKTTKGD